MKLWILISVLMHVGLFSAQSYPSPTTPIYQQGGSQVGQYQPGVAGINIDQLEGQSAYNPNVQQGGIPIGNQQIVQPGFNSGIQQGIPYGQQGGFQGIPQTNYQGIPQTNYQGIPQTNYQGIPQTNYQGIPQTNYPQQVPQYGNFQAPGPISFPG